jgi:3-methyladenine DNA glycosylase Tag
LQQSVKEKQKLYDKKHEDFQTKYQEIKTMDDKDIIKLIQEEEERVIKRREQIEATIKENNEKFDLLVIKKGKLMDAASKIMLDEKAIEEQGKQVSELGM